MILGRLWMTLMCVGKRCHGANGVLLAVNVTGKAELFLEEQFVMTCCADSESRDPERRFLEDPMCSLMTECGVKAGEEATRMCVCLLDQERVHR